MDEKDIQPSAQGKITKTRKGVFGYILDEVIVKNLQEIKSHFIEDVIIPSTLEWLFEVCSGFVNDMFKSPSVGRSTPLRSYSGGSYTAYSKTNKSLKSRYREESSANVSYKDISFDSRRDAEKVIADLRGDIIEYGLVSVQDLCQYSGVEGTWADVNYGWTNLDRANSYHARDGRYYLNLPEPKPIEQD